MPYDVQGARKAGYSEAEIAEYLGEKLRFDVNGARKAGYSDAELVQFLSTAQRPGSGGIGTLGQLLRGIPAGGVNLLESAAVGASSVLPDEWEPAARRGIKSVAETLRAPFAERPGREDTVLRRIGEGVGSVGAMVPMALAGPLGIAGAAGVGIAAGAGEARVRAEQGGATEGERAAATGAGALVGASELLPVTRLLGRLGNAGPGVVGMLKRALVTGGEEGVQEAAANIAQNLIERGIYNPEKGVFTDTGEALGYGAGTGALVSAVADIVLGGRRRGAVPPPAQPAASAAPEAPGTSDLFVTEGRPLADLSLAELYLEEARLSAALDENRRQPEIVERIKEVRALKKQRNISDVEARKLELNAKKAVADREAELAAQSVFSEETLPEVTPREGFAPPEIITREMLVEAGMPADPKNKLDKEAVRWLEQNVLGKSKDELQALVEARPALLKTPGKKTPVLKNLLLPTPPAFVEGVQREPVSGPEISEPSGPVVGAGEPGVELPQAGVGEQVRPAAAPGVGAPAGVGVGAAGEPVAGEPAAEGARVAALEEPAAQAPTEPLATLPEQPTAQGEPVTVDLYRGVPAGRDPASTEGTVGEARFMSPDQTVAQVYAGPGGQVAKESVTFKNLLSAPSWMAAKDQLGLPRSATMDDLVRAARAGGYDGVSFTTSNGTEYIQIPEVGADQEAAQQAPVSEIPAVSEPRVAEQLSAEEKAQLAEYGLDRRPTVTEVPGGRKVRGTRYQQAAGTETPLSADAIAELEQNNLVSALSELEATTQDPAYRALAARLKLLLGNTDVVIRDDLKQPDGTPAAGAASSNGNTIWLDRNRGLNEETLLHEAVHAATERVIVTEPAKRTAQQNVAIKELNDLWASAKADPGITLSVDAQDSLSEFVTEAITNPKLIEQLKNTPWKKQTAWDQFKQIVLKALGVKFPSNMYEAAMASMDTIFSKPAARVAPPAPTPTAGAVPRRAQQPPTPQSPTVQQMLASVANQSAKKAAFKSMVNGAFGGPGKGPTGANNQYVIDSVTKIRTKLADKAATVFDVLNRAVDDGMISAVSAKAMQVGFKQAEAADQMLPEYYRRGALAPDPIAGWTVVDSKRPPASVFPIIEKWGKAKGMTMDQAWDVAAMMIQAPREYKFRDYNRTAKAGDPKLPQSMSNADIDLFYQAFKADKDIQEVKSILDEARIALIDHMVRVGRISKDLAKEWTSAAEYVPLDRLTDKEIGILETHFRQRRTTGKGLSSLGGLPVLVNANWVDRPTGNVIENYFSLLGWMVQQVVRTDALNKTVQQLEAIGQARRVGTTRPGTETAVMTYKNGVRIYYETPTVYHAMAFNARVAPTLGFMKVMSNISNVLRTSITALPTFTAGQLPQDTQRAIFYSGVKDIAALTSRIATNFAALSKHAIKGTLSTAPETIALRERGVAGDVDFRLENPAQSLLEEFGYKSYTQLKSKTFGTLLHRMNEISRASDLAVRQGIYDQTLLETGDRLLALQRAREIINFRTSGAGDRFHILHSMLQTIPFFGSYVQGMDIVYRGMTGKNAVSGLPAKQAQKKFFAMAGSLMAASILYSLAMAGEDEYESMSLEERDKTWVLGGGFGIPVPSEIGMLFKAIPERVTEYFLKQGTPDEAAGMIAVSSWFKSAFKEYFGRITPIPSAARPLLETWMDYSIRTGRELEGAYQEGLEIPERVTSTTSEFAREVARFAAATGITKTLKDTLNVELSPIKIDNLLNGYFGTTAALGLATMDALVSDRADRPLSRMIGLTPFTYEPVGTRYKDEFYELRERVAQAQQTINLLMRRDVDAAYKYAQDRKEELMLYRAVNATLNHLKATRDRKNWLDTPAAAEQMSGAERLQQKREMEAREQELTKWTREARRALGL